MPSCPQKKDLPITGKGSGTHITKYGATELHVWPPELPARPTCSTVVELSVQPKCSTVAELPTQRKRSKVAELPAEPLPEQPTSHVRMQPKSRNNASKAALFIVAEFLGGINHNAAVPTPKPGDNQHTTAAELPKCTTSGGNKNDADKKMPVVEAPLSQKRQ
jgi:hypothetical protein